MEEAGTGLELEFIQKQTDQTLTSAGGILPLEKYATFELVLLSGR